MNTSFEFFPPKTPQGFLNLMETAKALAQYSPDFFSVTYGAGGSTREGTVETIKQLQQAVPIPVAPHLSCIGSTRVEIIDVLRMYQSLGSKRIVVLRGDLPSGMGNVGELKYACELVKLVRDVTGDHFHIEVAAYPECHPQATDAVKNLAHFKSKVDAGADSAITQYFYNPDAYFYFLDSCAKQNISIPIIPGIMPITDIEKLERFSTACGAEIPRWLHKGLMAYEHDEASLKAFGIEVVHKLCERLLQGGAPGLHFYTLNKAEGSSGICEKLHKWRARVGSNHRPSASEADTLSS